jgi:hypothetical protein
LQIELAQLMVEVILKEDVVDAAVRAHRIEIEFRKRGDPLGVKLFHPGLSRGRRFNRVKTSKAAAVGCVPLDDGTHLARSGVRVVQSWDGVTASFRSRV